MFKNLSSTIVLILGINLFIYTLHHFLFPVTEDTVLGLQKTYLVNAITTVLVFVMVFFAKDVLEDYVGFVFLGLSLLKMIFFFAILNPTGTDDKVSNTDAITFFVPYFVNLILEILLIVKLLNIKDLAQTLKK